MSIMQTSLSGNEYECSLISSHPLFWRPLCTKLDPVTNSVHGVSMESPSTTLSFFSPLVVTGKASCCHGRDTLWKQLVTNELISWRIDVLGSSRPRFLSARDKHVGITAGILGSLRYHARHRLACVFCFKQTSCELFWDTREKNN